MKNVDTNKKNNRINEDIMKDNLYLKANLRMTNKDLECAFHYLSKREQSRYEYIDRIQKV